jgi:hypothetical protein
MTQAAAANFERAIDRVIPAMFLALGLVSAIAMVLLGA